MTPEIQRKYAHLVLDTTPGPHNHMMAELAAVLRERRITNAVTNYWARYMTNILVSALSRPIKR